jgi:hypothetical protein
LAKHKDYAETYIDDVVIFSDDWHSHLRHVEAVMDTLDEGGFTLNLHKCSFAHPEVRFLGHLVGSGTHSPDPEKVEAIKNLLPPKTKKDVRSLLGLMSYYRAYVPSFSQISHPLSELTKRRSPNEIHWQQHHQEALDLLKNCISNAPKCHTPDYSKPFVIFTDASDYAVGACLSQKIGDTEYPIAFASKKLSPAQHNYAVIEKEAYAVIFALRKFEPYVFGSEIDIVSDHNPLTYLTDCIPQSARLQRWCLALQKYQAKITYRKGKCHLNADALSRLKATHWDSND